VFDGPAIARNLDDQGFSIVEGVLDQAKAAALKAPRVMLSLPICRRRLAKCRPAS
jgi:hypothetical protein